MSLKVSMSFSSLVSWGFILKCGQFFYNYLDIPIKRSGKKTWLSCVTSGFSCYRRREDSIQDDRGSFVTTPTAELSTQEESLLDNFLDWSLDSCSGYEGDQESEGERDGDGEAFYSPYKKQTRELNLSFHLCLKLFLRQQKPELSAGDQLEKLFPFPSGYNC